MTIIRRADLLEIDDAGEEEASSEFCHNDYDVDFHIDDVLPPIQHAAQHVIMSASDRARPRTFSEELRGCAEAAMARSFTPREVIELAEEKIILQKGRMCIVAQLIGTRHNPISYTVSHAQSHTATTRASKNKRSTTSPLMNQKITGSADVNNHERSSGHMISHSKMNINSMDNFLTSGEKISRANATSTTSTGRSGHIGVLRRGSEKNSKNFAAYHSSMTRRDSGTHRAAGDKMQNPNGISKKIQHSSSDAQASGLDSTVTNSTQQRHGIKLRHRPGVAFQGSLAVVNAAQDADCFRMLYALALLAQNRVNEAHNVVTLLEWSLGVQSQGAYALEHENRCSMNATHEHNRWEQQIDQRSSTPRTHSSPRTHPRPERSNGTGEHDVQERRIAKKQSPLVADPWLPEEAMMLLEQDTSSSSSASKKRLSPYEVDASDGRAFVFDRARGEVIEVEDYSIDNLAKTLTMANGVDAQHQQSNAESRSDFFERVMTNLKDPRRRGSAVPKASLHFCSSDLLAAAAPPEETHGNAEPTNAAPSMVERDRGKARNSRRKLEALHYVHALVHRYEAHFRCEFGRTGYQNSNTLLQKVSPQSPIYAHLRKAIDAEQHQAEQHHDKVPSTANQHQAIGMARKNKLLCFGSMLNTRIAQAVEIAGKAGLTKERWHHECHNAPARIKTERARFSTSTSISGSASRTRSTSSCTTFALETGTSRCPGSNETAIQEEIVTCERLHTREWTVLFQYVQTLAHELVQTSP
ncbi:unnamed protein product [Amoebophrya sp. A25]|nr:unnamed protein product [Amoebophrya sp. A25]|eukprot:GSA25T00019676001.1